MLSNVLEYYIYVLGVADLYVPALTSYYSNCILIAIIYYWFQLPLTLDQYSRLSSKAKVCEKQDSFICILFRSVSV
jgi:hypothetical protein